MPIKLSKLVPKNVRKPLNTRAQNKRKSIEKAAEFPQENYELRELLKNTKPRNIPQSVEEKCKALSPNAMSTMIRGVSEALETASNADKRILQVTLHAPTKLLRNKNKSGV